MNLRRPVVPSFILVLATIASLTGCTFFVSTVRLDSITLDVAPQANDGSPIAVDFVAVRDPELLERLSGIGARQWFAEREQYLRDANQRLSIRSLELVPGQFVEALDWQLADGKVAGLLVFAGYGDPGAHPLRLAVRGRVWLRFDSRELRLLNE